MEYQVSALKWRPQNFADLVGQEAIIQTLSNAIRLDRVAHAYLFSGTRGVGKTTMARILAKALNCESGPTPEPCGTCSFCVEIRQGNCIDVMEIDGASNNGVAEVRDLIENVQYAASACRNKIYIIDEVHMLSKSAFNALLKTLEEPPPRVVFIFATTELIKIPETILSRCQCFEFKALTQRQIVEQMRLICDREEIAIDNLGLERIAKNASGSMRDSQSLLDQVIAFCGKKVEAESVESILGIVARDVLEGFIDRLAERDCPALIGQVRDIADAGKDLNSFCRDLIEYLRDLLLAKVTQQPETLLDPQTCNLPALKRQAEKFHADELQQMFTVLSHTEAQMKRSPLPQILLEMAVLRLADVRPFRDIGQMIDRINRLENEGVQDEMNFAEATARREQPATGQPAKPPSRHATPADDGNEPPENEALWRAVTDKICAQKSYLAHYLDACRPEFPSPEVLQLNFSDPFTLERIKKEENLKIISEAVNSIHKADMEIKLVLKNAENAPDSSDIREEKKNTAGYNGAGDQTEIRILRDALDIFGGTIVR
ncbi:MAG: DNA polymerase III subunit gamma/tau [Nitrospinales bacterium]